VTLVDTNVLLDMVTNDPVWFRWSIQQLEAATLRGPLFINDVIYAELSARYQAIEDLDRMLNSARITVEPMPKAALFLAGKAFLRYRKRRDPRTGVLPDFFVGAHAAVLKCILLTRDTHRYRTYFPTLDIISPLPASIAR
jgi:predicted nucleic acid-binding protein